MVIYSLLFAVSAGFAVIVAATMLAIIGVRQEERCGSLTQQRPPTIPALLARRVLGAYAHLLSDGQPARRSVGPRRDPVGQMPRE